MLENKFVEGGNHVIQFPTWKDYVKGSNAALDLGSVEHQSDQENYIIVVSKKQLEAIEKAGANYFPPKNYT